MAGNPGGTEALIADQGPTTSAPTVPFMRVAERRPAFTGRRVKEAGRGFPVRLYLSPG